MASTFPFDTARSRAATTAAGATPSARGSDAGTADVSIIDSRAAIAAIAAIPAAEDRACECAACVRVRRTPFQCDRCGYAGAPLVAACAGSVAEVDAELARNNRLLQQINASGRDSYRETLAGTQRTIKHTRRDVEARLAALTRARQLMAVYEACATGGDRLRGAAACPCCGTGDLADSNQDLRERRGAFVRDILRLAESHQAHDDLTAFEMRVWRLAAKYI